MALRRITRNSKLDTGKWLRWERSSQFLRRVSGFEFPASNFQFPVSSFFPQLGGKFAVLAAVVAVLLSPSTAAAQGCAMCYTTASSAKQAALEALQNGILILLVPPLLMFVGILWLAFRRRNAEGGGAEECEEDSDARSPRLTGVILSAAPAEKHLPENRRIA
jgi:hypothetical protein